MSAPSNVKCERFSLNFPLPRLTPCAAGKAGLMRQKIGGAEPDSLEVCDIECGNAQGSRQGTPTRCPRSRSSSRDARGREAQQLASLPSVSCEAPGCDLEARRLKRAPP